MVKDVFEKPLIAESFALKRESVASFGDKVSFGVGIDFLQLMTAGDRGQIVLFTVKDQRW